MERSEYQEYFLNAPVDEVFDCKKAKIPLPEWTRIFLS
jgi:hypothetical protein